MTVVSVFALLVTKIRVRAALFAANMVMTASVADIMIPAITAGDVMTAKIVRVATCAGSIHVSVQGLLLVLLTH